MKRLLFLIAMAIALCSIKCHAQTKDVTEDARHEIARRGNHVEQTGTIRSNLISAALAPPADDSGKWFVTLVTAPKDANSDRMRDIIARDPDIRPWINTADAARSNMHYQERSIDDQTQQDWLRGLRTAIEKYGLPALVIQPPRSGQFGKPEVIVKMIHGVWIGKELAGKFREGIVNYVQTIEADPIRIGIAQADVIGISPPFPVRPQDTPPVPTPLAPMPPMDWPPSAPKALTLDQIRSTCDGATPEFLLECLNAKETDLKVVELRWLIYQKEHPLKPVPDPASNVRTPQEDRLKPELQQQLNPSLPVMSMPLVWLAIAVLVAFGAGIITMRVWSSVTAKIAAYHAAIEMMTARSFPPDQGPTNPPSSPSPRPIMTSVAKSG